MVRPARGKTGVCPTQKHVWCAVLGVSLAASGLFLKYASKALEDNPKAVHYQQQTGMTTTNGGDTRTGPFTMPIAGERYSIFQPFYDMKESSKDSQLIAPPEHFTPILTKRISWANTMISNPPLKQANEYSHLAYLEMMKSFVSATVFESAELSVKPACNVPKNKLGLFDKQKRSQGDDWTYLGDTSE